MENNQQFNLCIHKLKHELLRKIANLESTDSENTVLKELSSRIKESLTNIPEEKRTEIEALVDTFLQKELDPVFCTIAKKHGEAGLESLEILTKEAMAEIPSDLTQKLSSLNAKVDTFILERKIEYEKCILRIISADVPMLELLKENYGTLASYCTEILCKEEMKSFNTAKIRDALRNVIVRLNDVDATLCNFKQKMKSSKIAIKRAVKDQELCTGKKVLDPYGYAPEKVVKMIQNTFSDFLGLTSSVYFILKELMEGRRKCIPTSQMLLEMYAVNRMRVFSVEEMAEKLESAEKDCLRMGEEMCEDIREMEKKTVELMQSVDSYFKNRPVCESISALVELSGKVEGAIEKMQGPEKTEMEKFRVDLKAFLNWTEVLWNDSVLQLSGILKKFAPGNLFTKQLDARVRNEFALFRDEFEKIQAEFPNGEIKSGYENAFHALINYPRAKRERTGRVHDNAMMVDECLAFLRKIDEGESVEARDLRVAEYENFARKKTEPKLSGSVENITRESLEDGITQREAKAMLSSLNGLRGMCTEELEDEARTEYERVELKKFLQEIEERIRALEEKLLSFGELSKETLRENELRRYACLLEYKGETLDHELAFVREAEDEMVPLAKEVMREIEKTPNNPEVSENAKKMLEKILDENPTSLLTPGFILRNGHFWMKFSKVIFQLNKKIVETLEKTSEESRRTQAAIQMFIFGFLFLVMPLSLGLAYKSSTS
ncbi:uncharacterized protein NEMAJ01_1024 [Nematocida major]|uniref:uncharacterized protein n=1 Tax=Nematocida major TaxID=1912982 RepID=UPI0020077AE3|nr:uncharacterized protein NEMAJ01_1024 [Nematocida major]KAH9386128.1 hypothetical protein NEMAJ01_1024 [Nematocida major]